MIFNPGKEADNLEKSGFEVQKLVIKKQLDLVKINTKQSQVRTRQKSNHEHYKLS